jgi:hypothetical protein
MTTTIVRCATERRAAVLADALRLEVPDSLASQSGKEVYTEASVALVRRVIAHMRYGKWRL